MTGSTAPARAAQPAAERDGEPGELTPAVAGLLTTLVVAAGLLWRNRDVFRVPLYEVGDAAANSLLVNDAKAFDLLVGHYSRVGFNHPGPAVLYLQAAGEALFTDLLGLTPAAHNGQLVAVVLLHAATLGAVAAVLQRWSGRWPVTAVGVAVALGWYAAHEFSLAGAWIPVLVIPPFLLLLVASASVAAGHARTLPVLAATGGLLVHAHVALVLPVTVLATTAVVVWAARERLSPRGLLGRSRRSWAVAGAVVAAFLAPIAANSVLNWPGEVPKYLSYSTQSEAAVEPTLATALLFSQRVWTATEGTEGAAVPLPVALLVVLVAVAAAALAPRRLRLPLLLLTAATLLAQALLVVYALVGVDDLTQLYVGLFARSLPAALLLVVGVAAAARLDAVAGRAAPLLGVLAALAGLVAAASEASRVRPEFTTTVPEVLAPVVAAADGRPLLLDVGEGLGPFIDATALLLHAERTGVDACVMDEHLRVQVTAERICTPEQLGEGRVVSLEAQGSRTDPTTSAGFSDITVEP